MVKLGHFLVFGLLVVVEVFDKVLGHGTMLEPVGRQSRWRFNDSAPPNYDDNGLYCGGLYKQWYVNNGKCGLCGDDYSLPTPRPNEIGGKYGEGVIVRYYKSGNLIPIGVKLTANHKGFFYFNLCNLDNSPENEDCYQKNNLKLIDGSYKFYVKPGHNGWFNTTLILPKGLICKHCVLRWTYYAGNNWGICPNGTGAVGCGPQENFRSCADVRIMDRNALKLTFDVEDSKTNYYQKQKKEQMNFPKVEQKVKEVAKLEEEIVIRGDIDEKELIIKERLLDELRKLNAILTNEV